MRRVSGAWLVALVLAACGGGSGGDDAGGEAAAEVWVEVAAEVGGDTVAEVAADVPAEAVDPDALPAALPFAYSRAPAGEPVSAEEVSAFTRDVMQFLQDIRYFDYVLYTTHGVAASTGLPPWQFWYNERFKT